jgi:hypothetical protein
VVANIKKLRARFKGTKFGAYLPIIPVAATSKTDSEEGWGVENLIKSLLFHIKIPERDSKKQFF